MDIMEDAGVDGGQMGDANEADPQPPPDGGPDGGQPDPDSSSAPPLPGDECEATLSCPGCVLRREGVHVALQVPPDMLSQIDEVWLEQPRPNPDSCVPAMTRLWPRGNGDEYPAAINALGSGARIELGPVRVPPGPGQQLVALRAGQRLELRDVEVRDEAEDGFFEGPPLGEWLDVTELPEGGLALHVDKPFLADVAGIWAVTGTDTDCAGWTEDVALPLWPLSPEAKVLSYYKDTRLRLELPTEAGTSPSIVIARKPAAGGPLILRDNPFGGYEPPTEAQCAPLHLLAPVPEGPIDCEECTFHGAVVVPVDVLDAIDELWLERDTVHDAATTCQRDRQRLWPAHAGAALFFDTAAVLNAQLPFDADPDRMLPPGAYALFFPETLTYRTEDGEEGRLATEGFEHQARLVALRDGQRTELPTQEGGLRSAYDLPGVFPGGQCLTCRDCPNGCVDYDALVGSRLVDFLVVPPEIARVARRIRLLLPLNPSQGQPLQCLRPSEALQVWPPAPGTPAEVVSFGDKQMLRLPMPFDVPPGTRAIVEDATRPPVEGEGTEVELEDLASWDFDRPFIPL